MDSKFNLYMAVMKIMTEELTRPCHKADLEFVVEEKPYGVLITFYSFREHKEIGGFSIAANTPEAEVRPTVLYYTQKFVLHGLGYPGIDLEED